MLQQQDQGLAAAGVMQARHLPAQIYGLLSAAARRLQQSSPGAHSQQAEGVLSLEENCEQRQPKGDP